MNVLYKYTISASSVLINSAKSVQKNTYAINLIKNQNRNYKIEKF